jgi:hypothetical protein
MNAPFRQDSVVSKSEITDRFPRLSPAQKILQAAADRAIWQQIVAEMDLKPGISVPTDPRYIDGRPVGLEWGTWKEARHVLR